MLGKATYLDEHSEELWSSFVKDMNDFYNGVFVGGVQTIVGHPFDTIKVLIQNKKKLKQPMER